MATATKIQLVEFNKNKALRGATIAFSSNGQLSGEVSDYILDFRLNDMSSMSERYAGQSQKGGQEYYFSDNGVCSDNNELHNLFIVDAKIVTTLGTVVTKGEAGVEENINIDVLQPREYFAMYALQGILTKIDNPLALDDGQIDLISGTAFKIAQSMMSTAADCRAATQTDPPPASVDIDINNVTSTTDKLLYNMSQAIVGMQESLKSIKDTMSGQGDRVQKIDISSISTGEIPIKVTDELPVKVTNTNLNPVIVKDITTS